MRRSEQRARTWRSVRQAIGDARQCHRTGKSVRQAAPEVAEGIVELHRNVASAFVDTLWHDGHCDRMQPTWRRALRFLLFTLVSTSVLAISGDARAEDTAPVFLKWNAPAECPDIDYV